MRFLITGSSGFVGSHLSNSMFQLHSDLIFTDRESADLAKDGVAESLIDSHRPDYVIHLAARYGRLLCRDEPHLAVSDNVAATTELAAACAEHEIPVLYASSSEVYGDHGEDTISEDSELRTPTTIYGLSKRWGEEALRLYLPPENLCIVRLNMLYGPGQRGGYGCCALATFIRDALEGRPMTVHRDTSRSWLYVSDAVEALKLLIGQKGTWNLGNTHERITLEQTARMICNEVEGEYELLDAPPGQIRHKQYDCSKIEALGWTPTTSLRDGIRTTVQAAKATPIRDYQFA